MRRMISIFVLMTICACSAYAQQKGKTTCTPVPVEVRFDPLMIRDDGRGKYSNGVDGVTAVLECNATKNLTINTVGTKRTFIYEFPPAVPGSSESVPPQYFNQGPGNITFSGDANLFVHNILKDRPPCGSPARNSYAFTSDAFFMAGTTPYRLRFVGPNAANPPDDQTLQTPGQFPNDNEPFVTSNVTVTFHPGDCSSTPDSWTITGNNLNPDNYLQLGTLHQSVKSKWVHLGQYQMPFQLHVVAQKVF